MTDEATDPAASLGRKLDAFTDTLSDDELRVWHDIVHMAFEGGEVSGFAMPKLPAGLTCPCPCQGGEIVVHFPNTLDVLGSLHANLHRGRAPRPARPA